jgi:cysteinyl-tRNA synthetase
VPQTRLFNTLGRRLMPFEPLVAGTVRMYTCGPTVYNLVHIGNLRTFIFEDILRRYLKWKGLAVTQVMNLTDVDDKTIRGALEREVSLAEYTAPFIEAFFRDIDRLGIERAEHYPRATEFIPQMIALTERLRERGHTYESDGSLWYRIGTFPGYGKLSQIDLAATRRGDRVVDDEYEKEDVRDFALWKSAKPKEPSWPSPYGPGRPGWHLECSAMSMHFLGESFDIHTGAVDNIFPHHENEIAQSEGATGRPFVRYWLHAEHLIVDGEKMSKSKGNFYVLDDVLAREANAAAVRYLLLSVPYRKKLNFTWDALAACSSGLDRLRSLDSRLRAIAGAGSRKPGAFPAAARSERMTAEFEAGMDDDLNTAEGLAAVFNFVRDVNMAIERGELDSEAAGACRRALAGIDRVFGLLPAEEEALPAEIESAIAARLEARRRRDFAAADRLRDELAARGILLEDTPDGTRWRRK